MQIIDFIYFFEVRATFTLLTARSRLLFWQNMSQTILYYGLFNSIKSLHNIDILLDIMV